MAIVIFEHSDEAGSHRLGEVLRDQGHTLRVLRLHDDDPVPTDLDGVDGIVSCGGAFAPTDDSVPWIEAEMDYMRRAVDAELPIVGICMGNQVLGRALGGTVGKMDGGIELGWHAVDLTPVGREDPLHTGIAWRSIQPHWHRHEMQELPLGARVIASSERCPHQCWAFGLRVYGFQYHPEIHDDTLEQWASMWPEDLDEAGVAPKLLRSETAEHYPACARLADRLFKTMALVLMPVDRRYGVVKDLHH